MICSSEKRFSTSNLYVVEDWTPNRCATQSRGAASSGAADGLAGAHAVDVLDPGGAALTWLASFINLRSAVKLSHNGLVRGKHVIN